MRPKFLVRRLTAFALAMFVAVWPPVQYASVHDRVGVDAPSAPAAAHADWPPHPADSGPHMIGGTATPWQVRVAHDAVGPAVSPPHPLHVLNTASRSQAWLRLYIAPPLRTFPLLI